MNPAKKEEKIFSSAAAWPHLTMATLFKAALEIKLIQVILESKFFDVCFLIFWIFWENKIQVVMVSNLEGDMECQGSVWPNFQVQCFNFEFLNI